jgi:drug/metabolite transporter superfamily protein YnfA
MNKKVIMFFATIFSIAGAYVPALFGDTDMFSGWSLLGGLLGGLFGIWLAVFVSKRWG